jgi:hypothetical protein
MERKQESARPWSGDERRHGPNSQYQGDERRQGSLVEQPEPKLDPGTKPPFTDTH